MPTAPQRCDVEIAQSRNLDIELFTVQQRRRLLDLRGSGVAYTPLPIW
jgi:hypothetical protein